MLPWELSRGGERFATLPSKTKKHTLLRTKSLSRSQSTRRIPALNGRPVFASGIENRSRFVTALCGASNGWWTTTSSPDMWVRSSSEPG
jgi:hypothetical protein